MKVPLFTESWLILKKNKVLFVPNVLLFAIQLSLFGAWLWLSGIGEVVIQNDFRRFLDLIASGKPVIFFVVYLFIGMLIENFILTAKYGLIKGVLTKGKTSLKEGMQFAQQYYWTSLGIHVTSTLIVVIPLLLIAIVLFLLLPVSKLVAVALFIPLALMYLAYITIRLLFVYPVMAFHKKGAYSSLKEDFHFVKTHLHHTFVTWLILVGVLIIVSIMKANAGFVTELLYGQLFFLGLVGVFVILALEILVSVWEHVFIFRSYLAERRKSRGLSEAKE
ncbi:hypothetical protein HYX14_02340 [Candidatus Woesearchaeota archaeon]|nr:hypothetical protein [Candidatus Woesearchaeota archaeon]